MNLGRQQYRCWWPTRQPKRERDKCTLSALGTKSDTHVNLINRARRLRKDTPLGVDKSFIHKLFDNMESRGLRPKEFAMKKAICRLPLPADNGWANLHRLWNLTRSIPTSDTSCVFVTHIYAPYGYNVCAQRKTVRQ